MSFAGRRRSSSRTRRRSISTGCGWAAHEQTGIAGCFSVDEYENRRHQEARAHAARQGRRSHPAHRRAARADRRRVPDLQRRTRRRRDRAPRSPAGRRSTTSPPPTASVTRSGAPARTTPARSCAAFAAFPRSTSRTATTAPPARRERVPSCKAGRPARRKPIRFIAVAFPDNQMQVLPVQPHREGPRRALGGTVPRRAAARS